MADTWKRKLAELIHATKLHPDDGLAWSALGDFLAEQSENPDLAVRAYQRAQELLPKEDMRLRLGQAYVSNGETAKGISLVEASARERPRSEAYCILADCYLRSDQPDKAEQAARTAIELEPSFEEGHFLLGEALKGRDREAAIRAYRNALSRDERYSLAWKALGRELVRSSRIEDGVNALARSVELDGADIWARALYANGLWRLGRLQEAEQEYLAAIRLDPESAELRKWYQEFDDWRARLPNDSNPESGTPEHKRGP